MRPRQLLEIRGTRVYASAQSMHKPGSAWAIFVPNVKAATRMYREIHRRNPPRFMFFTPELPQKDWGVKGMPVRAVEKTSAVPTKTPAEPRSSGVVSRSDQEVKLSWVGSPSGTHPQRWNIRSVP